MVELEIEAEEEEEEEEEEDEEGDGQGPGEAATGDACIDLLTPGVFGDEDGKADANEAAVNTLSISNCLGIFKETFDLGILLSFRSS